MRYQMASLRIGIIGGTGWMGKAMADALLHKRYVLPKNLWIANHSGRNPFQQEHPEVNVTTDLQQLADRCDIIILSVLPRQFPAVNIHAEGKLIISIMASVSIANIQAHTHSDRIIRAMPNAAIPEFESYTPWCATLRVNTEDKRIVDEIFSCFGKSDEVTDEDQVNFMTALTGSSHGWLAFMAKSLIELGIEHGLSEELSERAVRQVMKGVGMLIAHEETSPKETVKILTDYAGTTAAGLITFTAEKMHEAIERGIEASYRKAKQTQ